MKLLNNDFFLLGPSENDCLSYTKEFNWNGSNGKSSSVYPNGNYFDETHEVNRLHNII